MRRLACVSFGLLWLRASSEHSPKLRGRATSGTSTTWAVEGDCVAEGACVSSPGYPGSYANDDGCTVTLLQRPSVVRIVAFSTEARYDRLVIEGRTFSGSGEGVVGTSFPIWSEISWTSDDSVASTGWELCVEEPPSCEDGLQLRPVPVSECPTVSEPLVSCDAAQPGDLCEGDGSCGTRTDINNCYDAHYSYPASRDVYQKATGTSRTVTTTLSSVTSMTSTTLTATLGAASGQPSWSVSGDCQLVGACVRSSNYPGEYGGDEHCTMAAPLPSVVTFAAFSTEIGYDKLTLNGEAYSGQTPEGKSVVAWTNISWISDESVSGSGWELCLDPLPSCADGLLLAPVAVKDCPDPSTLLPPCNSAEPGGLCEGATGSCGTREDINNCYDRFYSHPPSRDVYRKTVGTTRTLTTTTTTVKSQTTYTGTRPIVVGSYSGPVPWVVDGDCGTFGACAQSPNFPQPYGNRQSCTLSLPQPSVVRVTFFSTEDGFDEMYVNGYAYSGQSIAGTKMVVWTNITWASDDSVTGNGWQLCVEAPPYCSDGLGLVPVAVSECPLPSDVLPSCEEAAPGGLCEANGDCGTRTDVNNCYDSAYTYPASRDVYRKLSGTTSTTSTATTSSETTQTSTMTVTVTQIAGFWEGPAPWAVEGPCSLHGACVESPRFPLPYSSGEACSLSLPRPSVVRVTAFSTEDEDLLTINGGEVPGEGLEGKVFTVWSNISWSSSGTGKGWQICFEEPPSCADGLPLTPVPVSDCPAPASGPLPGCGSANGGELCLGDGDCGTRDDINNCYDAAFTYPPSLDVYRKGRGTTKTSTTVSSATQTTSVTLTTTHWYEEGPWRLVGSCTVSADCAKTSGDGMCTFTLPKGTPVKVTHAGSANSEIFSINGVELTPSSLGETFVVDTEISWKSDHRTESWWEVCIETSSCSDGLGVSPIDSANCPASTAELLSCGAAQPGDLCLGDGECLTYSGLNNCPPNAIYLKELGTTLTVSSTTSVTATFTPSAWRVTGPCTLSGTCVESPNYPEPYGPNERCEFSLPPNSVVTIVDFATELNYDRLTINGRDYSGPGHAIVGKPFVVESLSWRTDESRSERGWKLCLEESLSWRFSEADAGEDEAPNTGAPRLI